jgi:hypothetical protein
MKNFYLAILFSTTFLQLALAVPLHPKWIAHQQTEDEFLKLHFFTAGRGMHLIPDFVNVYEKVKGKIPELTADLRNADYASTMTSRWGFNTVNEQVIGFYNVPYKNMDIGVLGCVACHSGYAAGEFIVGLGNKNIDPGKVGSDLVTIQNVWKVLSVLTPKSKDYKDVEQAALTFAKKIGNDKINNLTQGHVATSLIRDWFYTVQGQKIPDTSLRGAVKVPHLWGYGPKREAGQFCDGYGNGVEPGWGIAVELVGGQKTDIARDYMPKVSHAEEELENFLPPPYPFAINSDMAAAGKKLFAESCTSCHGVYQRDADGFPIFERPLHFKWEMIQTDRDRLLANNNEFNHLVDINPLGEFIKRNHLPAGYFAPRLEGVWARFPYLHNGAVPSIYALLTAPDKRPKYFDLLASGSLDRYDQKTMGLTIPLLNSKADKELQKRVKEQDRSIFDTKRIGHSNQGHYFKFLEDWTEEDKLALIEYLKTL